MALFKTRTEKTKEKVAPAKTKAAPVAPTPAISGASDYAHVLLSPRITEKATDLQTRGAYVFDVAPSANKREVIMAVARIYKVTPRMVRMVRVPSKKTRSMRTGREGVKSGGKKAYVYLKAGDTITIS